MLNDQLSMILDAACVAGLEVVELHGFAMIKPPGHVAGMPWATFDPINCDADAMAIMLKSGISLLFDNKAINAFLGRVHRSIDRNDADLDASFRHLIVGVASAACRDHL